MEPLAGYRIVGPVVACIVLMILAAIGPIRFRFAGLGVLAAVTYGMIQDQVSVRLCPEYFTVFHPPISGLTDPTLLGISWGFLATWWVGLLLGYTIGILSTLGASPALSSRELVRPVALLVAGVAVIVSITGLTVWNYADMLDVSIGADYG